MSGAIMVTLDAILLLLEGTRRAGRGWTARCPAHADRQASLSINEGHDGRILLHCFAGCSSLSVVQALGLELRDLFPARAFRTDPTRAEQSEVRQWRQIAEWRAALGVLGTEAAIVSVAGSELASGQTLDAIDLSRLATAVQRIDAARTVLRV
jgi:hypothetical protein